MARDNLHLILQLKFCYMQVYNTGELRFRWGVASRLYESTNPEVPRRNKPGIWVSRLRDSVLFTVFWGNRFSRDFHWLPHKICPYSEMETRIPPHSQPPMTRVWTRQPVTCKPPSQPPRTAPSSLWPWHSPAVLGQILRDNSTQGTAGWLPIRPTLSKRLLKLLGVECPSPCSLLLYSLLM